MQTQDFDRQGWLNVSCLKLRFFAAERTFRQPVIHFVVSKIHKKGAKMYESGQIVVKSQNKANLDFYFQKNLSRLLLCYCSCPS